MSEKEILHPQGIMQHNKEADFEFIDKVHRELDRFSKYHRFVPLHSYQGTLESSSIIRRPSDEDTALLLFHLTSPAEISSPFMIEVFDRKDVSYKFFRQLSLKSLMESVLIYAEKKLSSDEVMKRSLEALARKISGAERFPGKLNGAIDDFFSKETIHDFAVGLGDMVYSIALPAVSADYYKKIEEGLYPRILKLFSRKKNKLDTAKTLDSYITEYGSSSLSADVDRLRVLLGSEEYISSAEKRQEVLGSIKESHKENVSDIVNSLNLGESLDDLDEAEKTRFNTESDAFREDVLDACCRWFNFTSNDIKDALRKDVSAFGLDNNYETPEAMLKGIEAVVSDYAKKAVSSQGDQADRAVSINEYYVKKIFSLENLASDLKAMLDEASPLVAALSGKASSSVLDDIVAADIYDSLQVNIENNDIDAAFNVDFVSKIYSDTISEILARRVVGEKLHPVLSVDPASLVDAYVCFKASKNASLGDNLFSNDRDVIYGEDFSFLMHSTTGAFFNSGKIVDTATAEREGHAKYSLLRLSDASRAVEPGIDASIEIVYKLCDSVNHLHKRGRCHNGLSMNNILLSEDVYELLILGYNPEKRYVPSCFALPQLDDNDSFAIASILYTLIEGHVPFSSDDPFRIKEDIASSSFRKRAKKTPKKVMRLIDIVFNTSILGQPYSVSELKKNLAEVSKKFPSRSYYAFQEYINRVGRIHNSQFYERLGRWL